MTLCRCAKDVGEEELLVLRGLSEPGCVLDGTVVCYRVLAMVGPFVMLGAACERGQKRLHTSRAI